MSILNNMLTYQELDKLRNKSIWIYTFPRQMVIACIMIYTYQQQQKFTLNTDFPFKIKKTNYTTIVMTGL